MGAAESPFFPNFRAIFGKLLISRLRVTNMAKIFEFFWARSGMLGVPRKIESPSVSSTDVTPCLESKRTTSRQPRHKAFPKTILHLGKAGPGLAIKHWQVHWDERWRWPSQLLLTPSGFVTSPEIGPIWAAPGTGTNHRGKLERPWHQPTILSRCSRRTVSSTVSSSPDR